MPDALLTALAPAQLTRARLRIAWEMLVQVGERLDLVPTAARAHVADALSELAQAKALVEEEPPPVGPHAEKDNDGH
jgi:hypothetical protein